MVGCTRVTLGTLMTTKRYSSLIVLKNLIKYKGFQVAPADLEAMLIARPNINDAAVVSMKDEAPREVPVAFVIRSNGSQITKQEIQKYISDQ
ncbi:hypothetical protein C5167_027410, partial [Papaver somniferum]